MPSANYGTQFWPRITPVEFKEFDRNTSWLDNFYFRILKVNGKFKSLSSIIKLILTLGTGQESVAGRFSINSLMWFEIMQELSLIYGEKWRTFWRRFCENVSNNFSKIKHHFY